MCVTSSTRNMENANKAPEEIAHHRINNTEELKNLYNFGDKLGNGCFGIVIQGHEKISGQKWAIKIIIKAKAIDTKVTKRFRSFEREIIILKMVHHPHIIHLDKVYESPRKIYLILELCREELAEAFKRKKVFTEDETRYILKQLVSAICYLHKRLIIHRDLKLENILLAKNPNNPADLLYIKVSDFGLGIIRHGIGIDDMLHDFCGTLTYIAPEMLAHNYNQQCDIWSIGIIMYLLLKGEFPFFSTCERELMNSIKMEEPSFNGINISAEGFHLLTKMLAKDPILRIAASEIEQHPWILNQGILGVYNNTNIIDMMKTWKNEMMTAVGNECDWIATSQTVNEILYSSNSVRSNITLNMNTTLEESLPESSTLPIKKLISANSSKESSNVAMNVLPKLRKTQQSNNSKRVNSGREKDEKSIELKSVPLNKDRKVLYTGIKHRNVEHQSTSISSIMKEREKH